MPKLSTSNCSQRSFYVALFILLSLMLIPAQSNAQVVISELDKMRLINEYIKAVNSGDDGLANQAYAELKSHPDAVDYMQERVPQVYYSFQVRGLLMQIKDLESGSQQQDSITLEKAAATLQEDLTAREQKYVAPFSISEEKPRRKTNGEIVSENQGRTLQDNREIALGNPNQNRLDNSTLVQNRAQSMMNHKFQDSPNKLVPSGGNLSAVIDNGPRAVVKGPSFVAEFSVLSGNGQLVNIELNSKIVASGFALTSAAQKFTLYLEPGVNILKVTSVSPAVSSVTGSRAFVVIGIKNVVRGERRFSWELKQGQANTIAIEAEF